MTAKGVGLAAHFAAWIVAAIGTSAWGQQPLEMPPPFAPFLSAAELEEDLDALGAWVREMHPADANSTLQQFEVTLAEARDMFPSGATGIMAIVAFQHAFSGLADTHSSVDLGQITRQLALQNGVWPGRMYTTSRDGTPCATAQDGSKIDSIYGRSVTEALPMDFFRSQSSTFERAVLTDRLYVMAPAWMPFLHAQQGAPVQASTPSPSPIASQWNASTRSWEIQLADFQTGTWRDFVAALHDLERERAAMSASPERVVVDLTGNGGGELARAQLVASFFSGTSETLFAMVDIQGSAALREWARSHTPWHRRLGLSVLRLWQPDAAYAHALLRTPPGTAVTLDAIDRKWRGPGAELEGDTEVVVKTDGVTASCAGALAFWFQTELQAQLVGRPPYAFSRKAHGNVIARTLPNSKVPVRIATTRWSMPGQEKPIVVDDWQFEACSPTPKDAFLEGLLARMAEDSVAFPAQLRARFARSAAPILRQAANERATLKARQIAIEGLPAGDTTDEGQNAEVALAEVWEALRQVNEARDAQLRLLVPMAVWPSFDAILSPPQPAVLHFGVHDRMKCNVCKPQ